MKYATLQRCRMAGVAAFALSIVAIAGCGGGDSSGGSTTTPPPVTIPPVVAAINGVVIQSLAPSTVPLGSGYIVTVTGTGFDARDASGQSKFTGVKIGRLPANATVISDTTLTVVTQASLGAGAFDVRVLTTDGISAVVPGDVLTVSSGATGTTGTTTGVTTGTTTGATTGTTTGTSGGPPPPPV